MGERLGIPMSVKHRLYLQIGDHVMHRQYEQWGAGVVVEAMTSVLAGGTCLVRVDFEDGQQRTFDNNLESQSCCYYFGIRRHQHALFDSDGNGNAPRRPRRSRRPTKPQLEE